ncbi:unnamed protein product [Boreogadus saida]
MKSKMYKGEGRKRFRVGDEANYFCQQYSRDKWNNVTFLSVKDPNEQRFVSQTVVQQPVTASAQLGDPVALQCSITSQRTNHSNQCQGEPNVYWYRSGSRPSHPAVVYMNGNRSGECQNSSGPPSAPQSCVYTLPKNNVDSSDAGTYYCALAACGEVVFGNGAKLDITQTNWRLVTMVLGILLACCDYNPVSNEKHKKMCILMSLFSETLSASNQVPRDSENQEQQDGETDSLNYAALEFSGRKTKGQPLQHILLMPAAWSISAHEFCWCVSGRDKANHSPRLSAHLLLEPLSFVSHPVLERQTVSRRAIKPSDIRGAVCEHRSSGQVGWSRRLTQAAGMPPRPVCELMGAGPLAGGDEANYFCQIYSRDKWNNVTFLSVKDPNDQRFVSQTVVQQPVSASAQLGDPVALQCSITSQRTDHSNQCQGEPSVYWYRSGSGPSHPAVVYMNGNRSGECQNCSGPPSAPQSCVYTLPKNNVDSSDAGTYYCALAACGEVVFGCGTKLDITDPNHHLEIFVHRIMSSCCLLVNVILILIIHYRTGKQIV